MRPLAHARPPTLADDDAGAAPAAAVPARRPSIGVEGAAPDEAALVAGAQAGDLAAFETLYRRTVGRVQGLCRRLTGDPSAADELVQEVFVRAWDRLPDFRGDSAFATWLHTMAVHLALDERRAHGRRRRLAESAAVTHAGPGGEGRHASGPGVDLERALAKLPTRARAVFVLHDVEGHRHDEIAALLGVDVGTSKSQLHRARRLLRQALGGPPQ